MIVITKRLVDKKAIKAARKEYCQVCGSPGSSSWPLSVHHIRTRGSGHGDTPENLITLCVDDHAKAHTGQLNKEYLMEIVRCADDTSSTRRKE